MIAAGIKNIPLTKYLIDQVSVAKDRINALREYVPARSKDWVLERAGQRVQVIKNEKKAVY
jgi:malate dehydrogenase (quinone)